MLDIKLIRDNPTRVKELLARRGVSGDVVDEILELDKGRRDLIAIQQNIQATNNDSDTLIGTFIAQGKLDEAETVKSTMPKEKQKLKIATEEVEKVNTGFEELLAGIPNLPLDDVPVGEDESANVETRKWGEVGTRNQNIPHYDLGAELGLMDFDDAALLSGSRFVVLRGELARLERALGNFMIDIHTQENGYTEIAPPLLVRADAVFGVGQLPKFEEDLFKPQTGVI